MPSWIQTIFVAKSFYLCLLRLALYYFYNIWTKNTLFSLRLLLLGTNKVELYVYGCILLGLLAKMCELKKYDQGFATLWNVSKSYLQYLAIFIFLLTIFRLRKLHFFNGSLFPLSWKLLFRWAIYMAVHYCLVFFFVFQLEFYCLFSIAFGSRTEG